MRQVPAMGLTFSSLTLAHASRPIREEVADVGKARAHENAGERELQILQVQLRDTAVFRVDIGVAVVA